MRPADLSFLHAGENHGTQLGEVKHLALTGKDRDTLQRLVRFPKVDEITRTSSLWASRRHRTREPENLRQ